MSAFKFTELEEGEVIVFGPMTSTKTTSFSGGSGPQQANVSKTSGQTVGITSQRVIVEDLESASKTKTCANEDVQKVFFKEKQRAGKPTLDLTKVQTSSGQTLKLGLKGLPAQATEKLKDLFPNAEMTKDGGCFIATAAYGSSLAPEIDVLRHFRDTRLRAHALGRWALGVYERCSPPLAAWIAPRPALRAWVRRAVLSPILWAIKRGRRN